MQIQYVQRSSKFLLTCESGISAQESSLKAGRSIQVRIIAKKSGYPSHDTIVISEDNRSSFEAKKIKEASRFSSRLKAAATALRKLGFFGTFDVSHHEGLIEIKPVNATQATPLPEAICSNVLSGKEGKERIRQHKTKERNAKLVKQKKETVLAAEGKLACEVCDFEFEFLYGDIGKHFAECHHRTPLAQIVGEQETCLDDLAIVCANCHRMLHRPPFLNLSDLRAVVLQHRINGKPPPPETL